MTLIEKARQNKVTQNMISAAKNEHIELAELVNGIAEGTVVIPANKNRRNIKPIAIGKNLRTKVNANLGTSTTQSNLKLELKKLATAISAGADTVMDLSTGGDLDSIRRAILENSTVPVGTVPIYQSAVETVKKKRSIVTMHVDDIFRVIEKHAEDGVDFITVHCGVTLETVERLRRQSRLTDIVSRGGAFLVEWMYYNKKENPLYEQYDELLRIAKKYEVILSLGDGLRPGCLEDATDRAQIQELIILGELVDRARKAGVQTIVEGPGHVPLHQIQANVQLQKKLCKDAPFYVLGPLVTDIGPGYDHITAAIGGALAAAYGADFLCYVTPAEHLRLPSVNDVHEGVVALRLAAHAADIAKGITDAEQWDYEISRARKKLQWDKMVNLSIDPVRARKFKDLVVTKTGNVCTMCGEYCAMKKMSSVFRKKNEVNKTH